MNHIVPFFGSLGESRGAAATVVVVPIRRQGLIRLPPKHEAPIVLQALREPLSLCAVGGHVQNRSAVTASLVKNPVYTNYGPGHVQGLKPYPQRSSTVSAVLTGRTAPCHILFEDVQEARMEHPRIEELQAELKQLLQRQAEFLDKQVFGGASETELLEYELRQEMIGEICEQLARRTAA